MTIPSRPPSAMRREIAEQPTTLEATYHSLRRAAADVRTLVATCDSVAFFGRGTSRNAATYGCYLSEVLNGTPAWIASPAVDQLHHARQRLSGSIAFVISQSGETTEMVEAAQWARRCGAITVAVTNTPGSRLSAACDSTLTTPTGTESAVPATKSFTAQLLALAMVFHAEREADLASVGNRVAGILDALDRCDELDRAIATLRTARAVVFTARSFALAAATEGALKVAETTGTPCLGLSSAELQHGPQAMLAGDVPLVICAARSGPTLSGLARVDELARSRGAPVLWIGGEPGAGLVDIDLPEALAPIGIAVVAQVLAERTAVACGLDPDRPPGLTKVTQTAR